MARKLVELGVDILEAGFPIASEGDFEAVRRGQPRVPVGAGGGAGAVPARWTWSAPPARWSTPRRPRIHTFIATSDIHLKYKLKKSRQQVLEEAVAAVELARRYVDDVEFSAEDGARTEPDYLEADLEGGGGGRRAHGQPARHGGLLHSRRVRRADRPHRARRWAIAPSSACTATTTWAWRWPTRSPPCRRARGRSSAPSTASASAPATARSKKSS